MTDRIIHQFAGCNGNIGNMLPNLHSYQASIEVGEPTTYELIGGCKILIGSSYVAIQTTIKSTSAGSPYPYVYLSTAYYYYKDIVKYNHSTTIVTDPTDTEESSFYSLYMILSLVFVGTSFGLRKKRRDRLSSP